MGRILIDTNSEDGRKEAIMFIKAAQILRGKPYTDEEIREELNDDEDWKQFAVDEETFRAFVADIRKN